MLTALLASAAGVALFGIAVLFAMRLVAAGWTGHRDDSMVLVLTVVGSVLIAMAFLGPMVALLNYVSIPLALVGVVIGAMTVHRTQRARQYALLSLLAVAAERLMPLVPAIEAYAEEQGGRFGARLRGLVARLRAGTPLPLALREARGVIPPEAMAMIHTGIESGALGPALRKVVAGRNADQPLWDAVTGKVLYFCALLWIAASVTIFMMWNIMPAMQRILFDFGLPVPAATQFVIDAGAFGVLPWIAALVLLLYAVAQYCGWIRWRPPGLGWVIRRRDTAVILDALALVAERNRPMVEGLSSLANSYPVRSIRRRLTWAVADVASGVDWCESLRRRGLIGRADAAVCQAAQRAGNLAWALAEMADSNRRRLAYRLQLLLPVLFPLVVLAIGALVMTLAVGYFVPLVDLIYRAAPGPMGFVVTGFPGN
jgi:type II secretory pathway component PulF